MRTLLLALALTLGPAVPTTAQTVVIDVNLASLGVGQSIVWPSRLDGGRRFGYLVYDIVRTQFFLIVVRGDGICFEAPFTVPDPPAGGFWILAAPRDGDGDGDDDFILQAHYGDRPFKVINLDLVSCR